MGVVFIHGISQELIAKLEELTNRFHAQKLVLFGSRARGDHHSRSDIDLAVYGLLQRDEMRFRNELDALETLLKIDLVHVKQDTNPALLECIRKDGLVLMERKTTKAEQFNKAVARTQEGLAEYDQTPSKIIRDGIIQRFEFTTELAWKSCREKLTNDGFTNLDSPKATMRTAYAAGLIDDEQGWLDLLQTRNLTSHMYSEEQADDALHSIRKVYVPLFETLTQAL